MPGYQDQNILDQSRNSVVVIELNSLHQLFGRNQLRFQTPKLDAAFVDRWQPQLSSGHWHILNFSE